MRIKVAVEATAKTLGIELNSIMLDENNDRENIAYLQALVDIQTNLMKQELFSIQIKNLKKLANEESAQLG